MSIFPDLKAFICIKFLHNVVFSVFFLSCVSENYQYVQEKFLDDSDRNLNFCFVLTDSKTCITKFSQAPNLISSICHSIVTILSCNIISENT